MASSSTVCNWGSQSWKMEGATHIPHDAPKVGRGLLALLTNLILLLYELSIFFVVALVVVFNS
jgi:hypothetical protein